MADLQATIGELRKATDEARAALYGAREVLGDAGNIYAAIAELQKVPDLLLALEARGEPVAWMDASGNVLSAEQKRVAENHQGIPGKRIAEGYSTPLYAAPATTPDRVSVPVELFKRILEAHRAAADALTDKHGDEHREIVNAMLAAAQEGK